MASVVVASTFYDKLKFHIGLIDAMTQAGEKVTETSVTERYNASGVERKCWYILRKVSSSLFCFCTAPLGTVRVWLALARHIPAEVLPELKAICETPGREDMLSRSITFDIGAHKEKADVFRALLRRYSAMADAAEESNESARGARKNDHSKFKIGKETARNVLTVARRAIDARNAILKKCSTLKIDASALNEQLCQLTVSVTVAISPILYSLIMRCTGHANLR